MQFENTSKPFYSLWFEDMQIDKQKVLRDVFLDFGWKDLAARVDSKVQSTHWKKAPEALCRTYQNCDQLIRVMKPYPCIRAQLQSKEVVRWSLPNSIEETCAPVRRLRLL